MSKKVLMILSVVMIVAFIGYIIADFIRPSGVVLTDSGIVKDVAVADAWTISNELRINEGGLKTVTVTPAGKIYLGGDSFVSCYDKDLNLIWNVKTAAPVTSLCNYGDTIYATSKDMLFEMNPRGKVLNEWGPFEDSSLFTSVSANRKYVALADAANKMIFLLDKGGEVKKMIGQKRGQFIVPSPYFDVALDNDNNVFIANTGRHRIETYTPDGVILNKFGEAGTAPDYFCGCCAPPHFILVPQGFVTAEKGINRIKILDKNGGFVEFVNSKNNFVKSVPLDVASADGITIYAANPADSKLYVFNRK